MQDTCEEYGARAAAELRTGIDLIEIRRIRRALKNPRFLQRFFGLNEQAWLIAAGCQASSVAVNFCAKEAFSKVLGTGIRGFSLREVELLRDDLGKPYLHFTGRALELVQRSGLVFEASVSHTRHYAVANVIAFRK